MITKTTLVAGPPGLTGGTWLPTTVGFSSSSKLIVRVVAHDATSYHNLVDTLAAAADPAHDLFSFMLAGDYEGRLRYQQVARAAHYCPSSRPILLRSLITRCGVVCYYLSVLASRP